MRIASRTKKKSRITQRNSYLDVGLFPVQCRERDGLANLTIYKDSGIAQPTEWYSNSKKTGHPIFTIITAFSRGILKQRRGRSTIHFNLDTVNTELLFQTVLSVYQISVHGAVTTWCYRFGLTEEENGRVAIPVYNKKSTMVEPEEVDVLVSLPNLALGSKMQGGMSFRILEKRVHMTQLCE